MLNDSRSQGQNRGMALLVSMVVVYAAMVRLGDWLERGEVADVCYEAALRDLLRRLYVN